MTTDDAFSTEKGGFDHASWEQYQLGPEHDQPPYSGKGRTYLIASVPRAGSWMLCYMLQETGELGSPQEYLHPKRLSAWRERLGEPNTAAALSSVMARRTSPSGWFGVKAHWVQFAKQIEDPDVMKTLDIQRWIRISRADRIAQAVSLVIAGQTGAWIGFQEAQGEPVYDFKSIAKAARSIQKMEEAWDNYFSESGITPLVIEYENMIANPGKVVADTCRHLGVAAPDQLPEPRTVRQASRLNAQWRERFVRESKGLPGLLRKGSWLAARIWARVRGRVAGRALAPGSYRTVRDGVRTEHPGESRETGRWPVRRADSQEQHDARDLHDPLHAAHVEPGDDTDRRCQSRPSR